MLFLLAPHLLSFSSGFEVFMPFPFFLLGTNAIWKSGRKQELFSKLQHILCFSCQAVLVMATVSSTYLSLLHLNIMNFEKGSLSQGELFLILCPCYCGKEQEANMSYSCGVNHLCCWAGLCPVWITWIDSNKLNYLY